MKNGKYFSRHFGQIRKRAVHSGNILAGNRSFKATDSGNALGSLADTAFAVVSNHSQFNPWARRSPVGARKFLQGRGKR